MDTRIKLMGWVVIATATACTAACSKTGDVDTTRTTSAPLDTNDTNANNTGVNQRDMREGLPTATDQGNSESDVKIASAIRRAIMSDDGLSIDAKNVKVIVNGDSVVLRGPVKSEDERAAVGHKAAMAIGIAHVENDLDIEN
jgi:hyperosmotically inducible periplasmic protein